MNSIRIIISMLILLHIFPIIITQLIILEYPFIEWENGRFIKGISTAVNILLNSLALFFVLFANCRMTNMNILKVLTFTCSYQDISRMATSNIFCLILSVLIGIGEYIGICTYYQDIPFSRFWGKYVLFFSLAAIPILLGYQYSYSGTSNLAIHEVCRKTTIIDATVNSRNGDIIDDEGSYIVIINKGILPCELGQMYLSVNEDELKGYALQRVSIQPGETYRFYISSENSLDIKKVGGTIVYLSNQFGKVIDSVEVPTLKRDESYINTEFGWHTINITADAEEHTINAPEFSAEGGFYDEAFELELTSSPGTTIYYTIDSSDPTIWSTKYSQPIYIYDRSEEENQYRSIRNVRRDYLNYEFSGEVPVDKCFIVRAIAVDDNGNRSDIVTKSYFINQERYKDRTVISLVSDPYGLFDDEYGICVTGRAYDEWYLDAKENRKEDGTLDTSNMPVENYQQQGIEWERESSFEVYENTNLLLSQQVGIRVQGHGSRYAWFYKRFSIFARDEYDSSEYFYINLINDHDQHVLLLREGDLYAISQLIGEGRNVATIEFKPNLVDVFLDGEFWYTTYLYEKFNEKNFSQKYNLSKDNIVIVKNGETAEGMNEGNNPYSNLSEFIKRNDLADDEAYWKYNEILDIQSFIDSCCINIFLQNTDYNEEWNNLFWHTTFFENGQEGDTRWRLGLYDMDLSWDSIRNEISSYYEINPFTMYGKWQSGPITKWPIYSALRKNKFFCKQFVLSFMDLINTSFSIDNTKAIMEKLDISDEGYQSFFENRAQYIIPYMAEEFELTGTQEKVTLYSNLSGTPVTINTISPEFKSSIDSLISSETFSWTGSYFTDYPVTVTANAPNFSHWEITANGSVQKLTETTMEIPVSRGGIQIHAVFK